MKVCHKEIDCKLPIKDITLGRVGLTYEVGDVSKNEVAQMVKQLESDGKISKMEVTRKGFFSSVVFLRKMGPQGIRKSNRF